MPVLDREPNRRDERRARRRRVVIIEEGESAEGDQFINRLRAMVQREIQNDRRRDVAQMDMEDLFNTRPVPWARIGNRPSASEVARTHLRQALERAPFGLSNLVRRLNANGSPYYRIHVVRRNCFIIIDDQTPAAFWDNFPETRMIPRILMETFWSHCQMLVIVFRSVPIIFSLTDRSFCYFRNSEDFDGFLEERGQRTLLDDWRDIAEGLRL